MADSLPRWRFERDSAIWHWFSPESKSGAFHSLSEALKDAERQGFASESIYWVVVTDGRTTHYRPGKIAVNLPNGEMPPE